MPSEFQQLNKRFGKPYSDGHRVMYDGPIKLLSGRKHNILDIGFGIGYGLINMISPGIIKKYVGCEPDKDSFEYVNNKLMLWNEICLNNCTFDRLATYPDEFDYTFCIEVIEHMREDELHRLLVKVWTCTKDCVFLSTPDPDKNKEGKWTMTYLINLFRQFQFNPVVIRSQWTNLWILNPINK